MRSSAELSGIVENCRECQECQECQEWWFSPLYSTLKFRNLSFALPKIPKLSKSWFSPLYSTRWHHFFSFCPPTSQNDDSHHCIPHFGIIFSRFVFQNFQNQIPTIVFLTQIQKSHFCLPKLSESWFSPLYSALKQNFDFWIWVWNTMVRIMILRVLEDKLRFPESWFSPLYSALKSIKYPRIDAQNLRISGSQNLRISESQPNLRISRLKPGGLSIFIKFSSFGFWDENFLCLSTHKLKIVIFLKILGPREGRFWGWVRLSTELLFPHRRLLNSIFSGPAFFRPWKSFFTGAQKEFRFFARPFFANVLNRVE
jgi:hypothetical protein